MDEVFKNVEYDWSGIEIYHSSTVAFTPKEVRVGAAVEYPNTDDQEHEVTHTHSVRSTEVLEIIKTESSSWNIHGGLSAEYYVGASTGIGYTKQNSEAVKRSAGENIMHVYFKVSTSKLTKLTKIFWLFQLIMDISRSTKSD